MTTPTPETPEYTPDALHAKARVLGMGNVLSWTEGWLHAAADAWKADKLRLAKAENGMALTEALVRSHERHIATLDLRLAEAEKRRGVLAKALTALYRHEDATADALAELAGFETWQDVYAAALAHDKGPAVKRMEGRQAWK